MTPAEDLPLLFCDGFKLPPDLLPKLNASGQYRTHGRCGDAYWTLYTTASWLTGHVQWSVTLNYMGKRGRRHYTDFAASLAEANAAGLGVIAWMAPHPPTRGRERWIPREVIGRSRRRRAVLRAMREARRVEWKYLKPTYEMKNQESEGAP